MQITSEKAMQIANYLHKGVVEKHYNNISMAVSDGVEVGIEKKGMSKFRLYVRVNGKYDHSVKIPAFSMPVSDMDFLAGLIEEAVNGSVSLANIETEDNQTPASETMEAEEADLIDIDDADDLVPEVPNQSEEDVEVLEPKAADVSEEGEVEIVSPVYENEEEPVDENGVESSFDVSDTEPVDEDAESDSSDNEEIEEKPVSEDEYYSSASESVEEDILDEQEKADLDNIAAEMAAGCDNDVPDDYVPTPGDNVGVFSPVSDLFLGKELEDAEMDGKEEGIRQVVAVINNLLRYRESDDEFEVNIKDGHFFYNCTTSIYQCFRFDEKHWESDLEYYMMPNVEAREFRKKLSGSPTEEDQYYYGIIKGRYFALMAFKFMATNLRKIDLNDLPFNNPGFICEVRRWLRKREDARIANDDRWLEVESLYSSDFAVLPPMNEPEYEPDEYEPDDDDYPVKVRENTESTCMDISELDELMKVYEKDKNEIMVPNKNSYITALLQSGYDMSDSVSKAFSFVVKKKPEVAANVLVELIQSLYDSHNQSIPDMAAETGIDIRDITIALMQGNLN